MDGCTAINFVKHAKIGFVQVGVVCAAWWHLLGFHNKGAINASARLCVLWQNLDEDSFDMLYRNDGWAAIPDPIWPTNVPYERKLNMLSSADNNFMIYLFDFERFSTESRFPFFQLTLYIHGLLYRWPYWERCSTLEWSIVWNEREKGQNLSSHLLQLNVKFTHRI